MKHPVFKALLVLSLVTSPVLAISGNISNVASLDQEVATQAPCDHMNTPTPAGSGNASDSSAPQTKAHECPCCDPDLSSTNKTCRRCLGGGFTCAQIPDSAGF